MFFRTVSTGSNPFFSWEVFLLFWWIAMVCRGFSPPTFISNPPSPTPVIGYQRIFRILLTPSPNSSRHLSLSLIVPRHITSFCIKPCYDHLMKVIEEWWVLNKTKSSSSQWLTYLEISNFMMSSNAKAKTRYKYILLNNLRGKVSLLMKFSQFMSYSIGNNLNKKFYQNCGLETSSRLFFVCKKLSTTSIGKWNFLRNELILDMYKQTLSK